MKKVGLSILSVLFIALGMSLLAASAAQASVVLFDVRGQATYDGDNSTQYFSGTLGVDVTTGSVTMLEIRIPFFSEFTTEGMSLLPSLVWGLPPLPGYNIGSAYSTVAPQRTNWSIISFHFSTTTPGSLVGFSGGTIDYGRVVTTTDFLGYSNFSGTISAVPEPSTWLMMVLSFAGLGLMACRRRSKPASIAT